VTNLPEEGWKNTRTPSARFEAGAWYEKFYCARGDLENDIKEQRHQHPLVGFHQLRPRFSTFAQLMMSTERYKISTRPATPKHI